MEFNLPETAINMLPFSAEPLLLWKGKTDIRRFIDALYAGAYQPFSSDLYKSEKTELLAWAKQFQKYAQQAHPRTKTLAQTINIPNFLEDQNFGKAAKYVVAWNCCVQSILEESGFYSLAHLLETQEEIGCSLLLASHLYYKQAMQVLRSFIEETLLPIHFCENEHEFNQ